MKALSRVVSLSLISAAVLAACGGGGSDNTPAAPSGPRSLSISFDMIANGVAAKCGTPITGLGSKSSTVDLQNAAFYVSNINLVDAAGNLTPVTLASNDWQYDKVALINFNDGSSTACGGKAQATNAVITGTVPAGNYVGIQYEIGVPESLNHTDYATAPKPLNVQSMAWSWTSGRKFMLLEVNPVGGVTVTRTNNTTNPPTVTSSTQASWYTHLGATGCTSDATTGTYACTNANRMLVRLNSFNPDTQKITLDLNAMYNNVDLTSDTAGAPGCMSGKTDTECQGVFSNLKIDLNSGAPATAGIQSVFIARAK
ncbi:MbnP family copper-binding protein [Undibacterium luofuense]|uniref:Metallo-mystery pair system four-Cys motif protein n=1 Tax=Undibacterium luofuense TaxID=2828733 RepID=A0A941DP43_9BURK|nr:MbnP family copper-binding protein [Undibacterium luofuense]MBR7783614.1 metallo-mystery pair system four-Cys motif protein [Undibacterium luofuense]